MGDLGLIYNQILEGNGVGRTKRTALLHFCSSISFLPLSSWPGFLPSLHSPLALNRLKMFSQMPRAIRLTRHCCSGSLPFSLPSFSFPLMVCECVCINDGQDTEKTKRPLCLLYNADSWNGTLQQAGSSTSLDCLVYACVCVTNCATYEHKAVVFHWQRLLLISIH